MTKSTISRWTGLFCSFALLLGLLLPALPSLAVTASAAETDDARYVWVPADTAVSSVLRSLGLSTAGDLSGYQALLAELLTVLEADYFDTFTHEGVTTQVLKVYRLSDGRLSFPATLVEEICSLLLDGSDTFDPLVTSGFYPSRNYFSRYYAAVDLLESKYKTSSPAVYNFIKNEAVYCTVTYLAKGSPGKVEIWWHNEPISVDDSFVITGKFVSTYVSSDSPSSLYFTYKLSSDTNTYTENWNPNGYTYLSSENLERSVSSRYSVVRNSNYCDIANTAYESQAVDGSTYYVLSLYDDPVTAAGTDLDVVLSGNTDYSGMLLYSLTPPETPVLSADLPDSYEYYRGSTAVPLIVQGSVSDGGTLSYEWYVVDYDFPDEPQQIYHTENTYTPPTDKNGVYAYYCVVTNTLGSVSSSVQSNICVVTVEPPPLGTGYKILNFKDFISGTSVSGTDKTYTVRFPGADYFTVLMSGFDGLYAIADYYTGSSFVVNIPSEGLAQENYDIELYHFPLGVGNQFNVLELGNIPSGIGASLHFEVDYECDHLYDPDFTLSIVWYDGNMNEIQTDAVPVAEVNNSDTFTIDLSMTFTKPAGAEYCTFSVLVDNLQPEENADFSARIVDFYLTLTMSAFDDIQSGIEDTNDKLDDIISGGQAGEDLGSAGDELDQGNEQLGGVIDDLGNASDVLPDMPDDIQDVLQNNIHASADSDISDLMPWNDVQYGTFWNIMLTPTLAGLSVALLLYFVFGKAQVG